MSRPSRSYWYFVLTVVLLSSHSSVSIVRPYASVCAVVVRSAAGVSVPSSSVTVAVSKPPAIMDRPKVCVSVLPSGWRFSILRSRASYFQLVT